MRPSSLIRTALATAALVLAILVTRVEHFGTAFSAPDATLAVLFLAGMWIRRAWLFPTLLGVAALASVLIAYAWFSLLSMMIADYTTISSAFDGRIWFLHIATLVICVGAALIAIWNAWLTWRQKRHWVARGWSGLLVIACLTTLWVALTFKLIAFNVNY